MKTYIIAIQIKEHRVKETTMNLKYPCTSKIDYTSMEMKIQRKTITSKKFRYLQLNLFGFAE